jgi:hypothetical protein
MSIPLGGGSPVTLTTDPLTPLAIAVDSTALYYSANRVDSATDNVGTVNKVALGGGAPITLAWGGPVPQLALDATSVYFTDPFNGNIFKTAK